MSISDAELWKRIDGAEWAPSGLRLKAPEPPGTGPALWFLAVDSVYRDEADTEGEEWKRASVALDDRMESVEVMIDSGHARLLVQACAENWLDAHVFLWSVEAFGAAFVVDATLTEHDDSPELSGDAPSRFIGAMELCQWAAARLPATGKGGAS